MPQNPADNPIQTPTQFPVRMRPFQIAQAETGKGTDTATAGVSHAETHAGAETGEEHHQAGEVPPASLLFANAFWVAIAMIAFAFAARRRFEAVPRGIQNFAEYLVEQLNGFTVGIVGPGGEKYTPLVGTVFLYILLMNLIGLVPGLHSPSGNITITLALGLVVFVYVQYEGIRNNGFGGYFKHFMGPMPALSPLMLPVEIISEFVKPFTLAVRLFGNIFGEDVILVVLAGLGATIIGSSAGWIPLHFPVMILSLITAFVQALVFSMLTCIYLSLMSHHEDGHGHGAHDAEHDITEGNEEAHMVAP